jgi:sulfite oxidase
MALWAKREDMIVHGTEPFNAEPPPSALAGRTLTPIEAFYARNHGPIPRIDPESWRLALDGLVERPATLSLHDLLTGFEYRELVATMQCAGNRRAGLLAVREIPGKTPWGSGAISTARWTGVSLADVLAGAGLRPEAAHLAFVAADLSSSVDPPEPFGGSIPVAKATAGEVLLAWAMNGKPLPRLHGGPVRLVVPGYIGARSVKWITRITAQDRPSDNHFQAISYRLLPADADPKLAGPAEGLQLGPVAVNADILQPEDGVTVAAGPTTVRGYASVGDDRAIARVDVSADDGHTWRQAELDPAAGRWAWRQWHSTIDLPAGDVTITARAWDTAAATQPEHPESLWNPGGYVNNAWARVQVSVAPAPGGSGKADGS